MAVPPLSATLPRVTVPFLKVIVPVGTPDVPGVTLAVNVTDVPCVDGFKELVTMVVVGAAFVVSVRATDVLAR